LCLACLRKKITRLDLSLRRAEASASRRVIPFFQMSLTGERRARPPIAVSHLAFRVCDSGARTQWRILQGGGTGSVASSRRSGPLSDGTMGRRLGCRSLPQGGCNYAFYTFAIRIPWNEFIPLRILCAFPWEEAGPAFRAPPARDAERERGEGPCLSGHHGENSCRFASGAGSSSSRPEIYAD